MPWNGAGQFVRLYSWETDQANGIDVRADRMDTDTNDIASGISNCIARDGQAAPTADIPWGNRKLTTLANGSNAGDAVNFQQVFTAPTFNGLTATGAVNFAGAATVVVPTVAAGDNSTNAASTAFATNLAFQAALPAISGGVADYVPTNNGLIGSWTNTLRASVIRFKDGTDATKLLAFDVSGVTTATTRTLTVPNKNGTMALLSDLALNLVATLSPTAAASVDALTAFSASYDGYLIIGEGLLPAASDSLTFRLANAGVVDSGSHYAESGNPITTTQRVQSAASTLGAGKGQCFVLQITNANDASGLKAWYLTCSYQSSAAPVYNSEFLQGAYIGVAATGISFYWSGGQNFVAQGKLRIYGYQNA